jgi:hypothetical protein
VIPYAVDTMRSWGVWNVEPHLSAHPIWFLGSSTEMGIVGPFRCPLGPTLGPLSPADSGIAPRQERQIVRSALGLHGFLPEYGFAAIGLTSRGSAVRVRQRPLGEDHAPQSLR